MREMQLVRKMSTVKRMEVDCLRTFVFPIFDRVSAFDWLMVENLKVLFRELSVGQHLEEALALFPEFLRGWLSLSEGGLRV